MPSGMYPHKKGLVPWNKGKKCPQISRSLKGNSAWNKGLTKQDDCRLEYYYPTAFKKGKDHIYWKGGIYINNPKEYKHQWYLANKERMKVPMKARYETNKNKDWFKEQKRESKKLWRKNNPLKMKAEYARHRVLIKDLKLKTVQKVYEDNIKKFGTLTCYLCEEPIEFGKDHLEHKIPLSREGTNDYENLAVACQKCNCSKGNRTEIEYRDKIGKKAINSG